MYNMFKHVKNKKGNTIVNTLKLFKHKLTCNKVNNKLYNKKQSKTMWNVKNVWNT